MKLRNLIVPTIAIAAIVLLASCSDDSGDGDTTSTADLYATQTAESSSTTSTPAAAATQPGVTPEIPFAEACVNSDEKQWAAPPPRIIDTNKTYTATITLAKGGDIALELFSDVPVTTNNFVFLACKGYYEGVTFHRVLPGFMAQGGDPTGTGSGGPGYAIPDEDDGDHTFDEAGAVSMANAGPNTAGSQFFITYSPQPGLEPDFTVFGRLIGGTDVHAGLTLRDPRENPTFTGDTIETITITEQ